MIRTRPLPKAEHGTRPAGLLLRTPALGAAAAAFLLAAWFSEPRTLLLSALLLSTALLGRLAAGLSLLGVRLERRFGTSRLFPGEKAEVFLRVENRKPLPVGWAVVEHPLPEGIRAVGPGEEGSAATRRRALWLPARRAIRWRFLLAAERRGYYPVGPPRLTAGDPFGLYTRSRAFCGTAPILVYPSLHPVDPALFPAIQPAGDASAPRRPALDPTRTAGVRPYAPGDGLKLFHWKATARRGTLQVRIPEATTGLRILLVVPVETFAAPGADFELALSAAASLAVALCGRGCPVGLVANTRLADSGGPVCLPAAGGRERLVLLLEALAKATASPAGSAGELLQRGAGGWKSGTTVVWVAGGLPDRFAEAWSELRTRATSGLFLFAGRVEPPADLPPDLPRRILRTAADLAGGGVS